MSLNKSIEHNKEHRKQYTGSKAIDRTCRNHGSCDWCRQSRLHKNVKREASLSSSRDEYYSESQGIGILEM